ncbi:hypothetical protein FRB94_006695 [Tulasnella sp. JGI-2019a]|nr:hypothetical protein FRB94_006695 [Tulasnella sp. JGI-2019a]KAG9008723.1 hypothetical protein FRB93_006269 [Tulasnella sp. JGI-2019a]
MTARSTTLITLLVLFAPQSALAVIPRRRRKSFSTGTTIGIVVAIVIIVIITLLIIFFLRRRRIRNANRAYATAAQGPIKGSLKIRHPSTTGVSAGGYRTTADPEAQNYATQPMS